MSTPSYRQIQTRLLSCLETDLNFLNLFDSWTALHRATPPPLPAQHPFGRVLCLVCSYVHRLFNFQIEKSLTKVPLIFHPRSDHRHRARTHTHTSSWLTPSINAHSSTLTCAWGAEPKLTRWESDSKTLHDCWTWAFSDPVTKTEKM